MTIDTCKLESAAQRLNTQKARIGKAISDADQRIVGTKINLEVWRDEPVEGHQIGFARVGGKWHLAARKAGARGKEPGDARQLAHAPPEVQLASLELFDEIIQLLADTADEVAKRTAEAMAAAGLEHDHYMDRGKR